MEKVRGPRLPSLPPGLPFRVVFPAATGGNPVTRAGAPITGQENDADHKKSSGIPFALPMAPVFRIEILGSGLLNMIVIAKIPYPHQPCEQFYLRGDT